MNRSIKQINRCKNCLISETFPGIKIGKNKKCNLCEEFNLLGKDRSIISRNAKKIDKVIKDRKNKSNYDIIVAFSGGKDSSYTVYHLLKSYRASILAFMVDNDFISERAKVNAERLTSELGVDLITFKPDPDFMCTMYRESIKKKLYNTVQLTRANAVCLSCINLINNIVLNEAIIRNIPIIAGGYIGGQVPSDTGVLRIDNKMILSYRQKNKMILSAEIDKRFEKYLYVSPASVDNEYPIVINPLLGMEYNEKQIIEIISKYGWKIPDDTGKSSSNCLLNDFAIEMHYHQHKYHSYEAEICLQVRRGTLSRDEALERLKDIKKPEDYPEILKKLNL